MTPMKKLFKNPVASIGLVLILAVIAGGILWNSLDLGTTWRIRSAVGDLMQVRNLTPAREILQQAPRGPTIDALQNALEDGSASPGGKVNVLLMLASFKESRAVRRAMDSDVLSTKRGAAYVLQGRDDCREEACGIALEWLNEKGAKDRGLAILILRTSKRLDAIPAIKAIVENEGRNDESVKAVVRAIEALNYLEAPEITDMILDLAQDASVHPGVRGEAFRVLTFLKDTPRNKLRGLLIAIIKDPASSNAMRNKAVSLLGLPENSSPEGWELLREIVLDTEQNHVYQRSALGALAKSYPLDKLEELLLDRKLYAHPYFGIRSDVATGLGNLRSETRLTLDILTEMLVDDDPQDLTDEVPRQAWLSWWYLSGLHYGASKPELFRRVPTKLKDEGQLRYYVFAFSSANSPAVSRAQINALDGFTMTVEDSKLRTSNPDEYQRLKTVKFAECKKIRDTYRAKIDWTIERWKQSEKKAEEKAEPKKKTEEKDD